MSMQSDKKAPGYCKDVKAANEADLALQRGASPACMQSNTVVQVYIAEQGGQC